MREIQEVDPMVRVVTEETTMTCLCGQVLIYVKVFFDCCDCSKVQVPRRVEEALAQSGEAHNKSSASGQCNLAYVYQ